MAVPPFQEIMLPFLEALADRQERSMKEMVEMLAARFALTSADREEMLPSGNAPVFNNRVAWTKTHLKNAGLVDNPSRGRVRLSEEGARLLSTRPRSIDMRFLRRFDSYRRFTGELVSEGGEDADSIDRVAELTPLELFESSYRTMRTALKEEVLSRLAACPPKLFERIVVQLLQAMGYGGQFGEGQVTNYSRDGGIDGVISEDKLGLDVVCIQAKRWQGTVGRPTIQAFVGSMDMIRAKKGVVIATSDFSTDTASFVDRIEGKRVVLIDGKRLAELMIDHNVGVTLAGVYELKEVSNDFFEDEGA